MLVSLLVVFNGFLVMSQAAPPAEHNGRSFRNALNQQSLQTILQSIEERLRNLDQVYAVRYASPSINTADQYIRKIEMLETKLSRMESQIEVQLQKISENMSSKNFKDDIAKDQLFRKIDSVYERINHKLSYVEGKLDMDILKLQTKLEAGISKIERLDHSFSVRQADMEAEVSEAVEMMESVKNNVATIENKLMNITKNTIEITFNKQTNLVQTKFDNVTHLIAQIDKKINNTLEHCYQKDFLNDYTNKDTHLTKTFKGYEDQIQSYGNKVNNMYNELWKKSTTIENTIKNSVLLMNLTRKEIQDLKKAGHKFTTHSSQNDGQLEMIVDSFTNTIQRKFAELGRKLESNFENVMLVQNLFLESCHRIQSDESQLENKISLVLEKLLDAVTNRSINTFKEIQSMEELIKSHDTNVYRTMNQNTNTIIKLSEKTSEDRKKLEKILSTIKKDIGNALETIQNEISSEDQENNQKFDTIANILLELQEQVNDLDSRVNEDNINYNAKQILQDILLVTKDLSDKDTFAEKLNSTFLHNVADLSKLMSRVYHLLTSIDTKINKSYLDYQPGVNNHRVNEEFRGNIINNNTKDHANIANFSRGENGKVNLYDEVSEPVDVVLEILPERNHKNTTKNSLLSRFNYTLISNKDDLPDYDEEINEYIPVASTKNFTLRHEYKGGRINILPIVNNNEDNITDSFVINTNYNLEIPEDSTKVNNIKVINYAIQKSKYGDSGIVTNTDVPTASTQRVVLETEEIINTKVNNNEGIIINGHSEIPEASTVINGNINTNVPTASTIRVVPELEENKIEKNYDEYIIRNEHSEIGNFDPEIPEVTTIVNNIKEEKNYDSGIVINGKTNIDGLTATTTERVELEIEEIKSTKLNKIIKDNNEGIIINGLIPSYIQEIYLTSNKNEETDNTLNENIFTDSTQIETANTDKSASYVTDTPVNNKNDTNSAPEYSYRELDISVENKRDISIKGFENPASKSENKNENNGVVINGNVYEIVTEPAENIAVPKKNKNFSDGTIGSTIADIPVSDTTIKSVKIESVTKETTEMFDDTLDEIIESSTNTAHMQNSFEYTDLKNNTNDENIRDEYNWDYED